MDKGFAAKNSVPPSTKKLISSNQPKDRLISWSPWPPASFQNSYPAFPFVLTVLILIIGQWYISLLK